MKAPVNENYAATIVTIKVLVPIANCDNVVHANIFGNLVVVDKETKVGDKGIFFPVETRLSDEFLHENNLYREKTKNKNTDEKGYFEDNGRIRCVKFRGNKSEGLFLPLGSLLFCAESSYLASLAEGTTFDEVNGLKICEKYVPRFSRTPGQPGSGDGKKKYKKVPRIVDGQFRLHGDTSMLGKNMHKITPDTILSITNKLHGTSFVVGKVLCKKKLNRRQKLLKWIGFNLIETHYDMIYSSRKVVKNDDLNKTQYHFYGEDLWGDVAKDLEPYLEAGMTFYGEIVGFTTGGKPIQGGYDYGYSPKDELVKPYGIYIYRITSTNTEGVVLEWSARQVQDWCKVRMLNAVPEFFYGKARSIFLLKANPDTSSVEEWQNALLELLQNSFSMEQDCTMCKTKVPAEGIVVRIEGLEYDAYKLKSFKFRERETKELDKGLVDIETQESQ